MLQILSLVRLLRFIPGMLQGNTLKKLQISDSTDRKFYLHKTGVSIQKTNRGAKLYDWPYFRDTSFHLDVFLATQNGCNWNKTIGSLQSLTPFCLGKCQRVTNFQFNKIFEMHSIPNTIYVTVKLTDSFHEGRQELCLTF